MNNINTPITLDEMDDLPGKKPPPASKMPGYRAKLRDRNDRLVEWTVEGAKEWEAARAMRAYNQERAPRRALAHTLQLVNDLLSDVGEGDGDPATFATLTILVGALGKLSRI